MDGEIQITGLNKKDITNLVIPEYIDGLKVTSIGEFAFYYTISDEGEKFVNIELPSTIKSIGRGAFRGCSSLTNITLPNSLTSIVDDAFYNCSSLTSITIPNSVTSIGDGAFRYCSSLNIYCEASSKPSGWDSSWNSSNCPVVWEYKG